MTAIERVMRAYEKTRKLTPEQRKFVRDELSKFIDEIMLFGPPELPADKTIVGKTGGSDRP
jgi:hypothetical protein